MAARSASDNRRRNAEEVIAEIQSHSPTLVAQTKLVSDELIRIAILWHEQWHEALEEASRLYFGEGDVDGMLNALMPLHDRLNDAIENPEEGETSSEKFFKAVRTRLPILPIVPVCAPHARASGDQLVRATSCILACTACLLRTCVSWNAVWRRPRSVQKERPLTPAR